MSFSVDALGFVVDSVNIQRLLKIENSALASNFSRESKSLGCLWNSMPSSSIVLVAHIFFESLPVYARPNKYMWSALKHNFASPHKASLNSLKLYVGPELSQSTNSLIMLRPSRTNHRVLPRNQIPTIFCCTTIQFLIVIPLPTT